MREVVMNDKSNLLQLEEHFYQLVDVDEPNTFRNLFPYEEIPKIALMIVLFRIICRMKSGLQIPHSVMGSSPVLRIPPNRS
jgi:hypothetical protein